MPSVSNRCLCLLMLVCLVSFGVGCGSSAKNEDGGTPFVDPADCPGDVACCSNAHCRSFEFCAEGECVPRPRCDAPGGFCDPGFFCSSEGDCIAEGTCESDGDCVAPLSECSRTGMCIEPGFCLSVDDCPDPGTVCSAGECVVGGECGENFVAGAEPTPINLLIHMDRSGSMANDAKWDTATLAVIDLVDTFQDDVRWGLAFFPDLSGSTCSQEPGISVPVADNNWRDVRRFIQQRAPLRATDSIHPGVDGGSTPIQAALQQFAALPEIDDPVHDTHILFVTDGAESCDGQLSATEAILSDLNARGTKTFVMGFDNADIDRNALSRMAQAGGTSTPPNGFFAVNNSTIVNVLQEVTQTVLSCTHVINEVNGRPPTPDDLTTDRVTAFLVQNGDVNTAERLVPGVDWQLNGNRATLLGDACEQFRSGDREALFTFDCPNIVPE